MQRSSDENNMHSVEPHDQDQTALVIPRFTQFQIAKEAIDMGWVSKMEDDFERGEQDMLPIPPLPEPIMVFETPRVMLCPPSSPEIERWTRMHNPVLDFRSLGRDDRIQVARLLVKAKRWEAIDKTPSGGRFWIKGGHELLNLEFLGMTFCPQGGRATRQHPGWYL